MTASGEPSATWIVDGMNVIGSVPDGWWRDRPGAVRRLAARLEAHPWPPGRRVTVVFDGSPAGGPEPARVEVRFAGRGRGAADDLIVELVRSREPGGDLTVVTSDRGLADRVSDLGVDVISAGALLRMLDDT